MSPTPSTEAGRALLADLRVWLDDVEWVTEKPPITDRILAIEAEAAEAVIRRIESGELDDVVVAAIERVTSPQEPGQ